MTIRRHILVLPLVAAFAVGMLVPPGDARAQEEQKNGTEEQQDAIDELEAKGINWKDGIQVCCENPGTESALSLVKGENEGVRK